MLNPDRAELRLQPTLAPENPRKNGHIPRWLRVPAFAVRTSLAILAAGSGAIAADVLTYTDNPAIVYADTLAPTLTVKPTPDAQDQQIAALQTMVADAEVRSKKDQTIKNLQGTATVLAETPTKIGTPIPEGTSVQPIATLSPADVTATVETARNEAIAREVAKIKATATAQAPTPTFKATPSPHPSPTSTSTPTPPFVPGEGGFPVKEVAGSVVGAAAAAFAIFRARKKL